MDGATHVTGRCRDSGMGTEAVKTLNILLFFKAAGVLVHGPVREVVGRGTAVGEGADDGTEG